jgi:hypothetical protein
MKRVLILSPYKGAVEANLHYGWLAVLDSLKRGEAPWASHLFYTVVMNDTDPAQRALGFEAEWAWLQAADLIAIYTDRGISPGMIKTINAVSVDPTVNIPIEMRSIRLPGDSQNA